MYKLFAGNIGTVERNEYLISRGANRLVSYHGLIRDRWGVGETKRFEEFKMAKLKRRKKQPLLFLDSGAFSAWSKQIEIDIYDYIKFIKDNIKLLTTYAVLDAIGDPEETLQNQKIMEEEGLSPLPCFHYGEDIGYLEHYLQNYDYIALGGMVPISTRDLQVWLERVFEQYVCDETGMPKVKIHGFGMTSHKLMVRYPWYSLDSTSWVLTGRFGGVYVPKKKNGEYNYVNDPWKVDVSSKSSSTKHEGKHFSNFTDAEQQVISDYIKKKGFCIGKSEIRPVKKSHKLKKNEVWFDRKKGIVEILTQKGVSNDYRTRDRINIEYFLDMEASMPKWPWKFKPIKQKGFTQRG